MRSIKGFQKNKTRFACSKHKLLRIYVKAFQSRLLGSVQNAIYIPDSASSTDDELKHSSVGLSLLSIILVYLFKQKCVT